MVLRSKCSVTPLARKLERASTYQRRAVWLRVRGHVARHVDQVEEHRRHREAERAQVERHLASRFGG